MPDYVCLILFSYNFVIVIVPVVWAGFQGPFYEIIHFILIKIYTAVVIVFVFVVGIENAGVANNHIFVFPSAFSFLYKVGVQSLILRKYLLKFEIEEYPDSIAISSIDKSVSTRSLQALFILI